MDTIPGSGKHRSGGQRLRQEGSVRPVAILIRSIHERIHGVHLAAFQVNHPQPEKARDFVPFGLPGDHGRLVRWPRRLAPDALIIGWPVDAASAVDLVVAQLHRNERGVPARPTSLLLEGEWRDEPRTGKGREKMVRAQS